MSEVPITRPAESTTKGTSGGPLGATPYAPNMIPPAAWPWWRYGLIMIPPQRLAKRQKWLAVLWFALVTGTSTTAIVVVLSLLGIL